MTAMLRRLGLPLRVSRVAVLSLLLLLLLVPSNVWAQDSPTIERLQVELRPEYDRHAVLVIYWIRLAQGTPLPTTVGLRIPAQVGEPFAVGMGLGASGLPLQADYTRQVEGEWATIVITTESLDVQLEYYDDLMIEGDARHFAFRWPGGQTLGALAYDIQQPFGSSDMVVTPPGTAEVRSDGLTYVHAGLGPMAPESGVTIDLSYIKTTAGLSVEALQPAAPLTEPKRPTAVSSAISGWLPWVLGAVAVLLLFGGALWYWQSGARPPSGRVRRRHRRPSGTGEAEAAETEGVPIYCHICGTQAGASDRFCRRCGTRLRP